MRPIYYQVEFRDGRKSRVFKQLRTALCCLMSEPDAVAILDMHDNLVRQRWQVVTVIQAK